MTGVRKIFVQPDGRPMLFYMPPGLSSIDQDRIFDLVAKGGGAFVSQPGSPPEVFTLVAEATADNLPEGTSAVNVRFVELSAQRGYAYDWRQFLIGEGEGLPEPPHRSMSAMQAGFGSNFASRQNEHVPSASEVPAPCMNILKKVHKGPQQTAGEDRAMVRPRGEMSCLANPAAQWPLSQPAVCEGVGGGYREADMRKGMKSSPRHIMDPQESDFDTTASDEEDIKANIDFGAFADPGAADMERRTSIGSGSITSGDSSNNAHKKYSRRNSKEAMELLAGIVEARRQEITKKDEGHSHGTLRKLAHAAEWFGAIAFFMSSLCIFSLWARHEYEEAFVTTFFVTSIASAAYLIKATYGDFVINGTKVPVARYLDWITTTPLMLYELCHLGHAPTHTSMFVIGCDILMLGFGIVSALISWKRIWLKHVWFFMSSAFYILMLVCLQIDVAQGSALDQPETVQALFKRLQVLTAVTWSFYPIVVILGRAHFKVISRDMEDILLMMLDVTAKIGMEGFIVGTCATGGCKADSYGDDGH